jgi:hypothetical protein
MGERPAGLVAPQSSIVIGSRVIEMFVAGCTCGAPAAPVLAAVGGKTGLVPAPTGSADTTSVGATAFPAAPVVDGMTRRWDVELEPLEQPGTSNSAIASDDAGQDTGHDVEMRMRPSLFRGTCLHITLLVERVRLLYRAVTSARA